MMRTANPALNSKTFLSLPYVTDQSMTLQGTTNKTIILLILAVLAAGYTWEMALGWEPARVTPWIVGGLLGGLVVGIITAFKKHLAPYTAPLYAVLEGLFLGGVSARFESSYPGIVFQAVALTFGTLFCLLLVYKTRLIRPTENFKLGVFAATGGIGLFYFAILILNLLHIDTGFALASSPLSIGISLFIVIIAALNLVLDFDFIESGVALGAPRYMEWYAAFGLLVTLVWLYLEILRLLVKLRDRR